MGGFFGWFLVIVAVLAVLNAEKLPALRKMMEEKFKESVEAAKTGAEKAKTKIEQVKSDIDAKKNSSKEVVSEENTPEEIEEALKVMGDYVSADEKKKKKK